MARILSLKGLSHISHISYSVKFPQILHSLITETIFSKVFMSFNALNLSLARDKANLVALFLPILGNS